jgi:hypothetical protein
VDYVQQATVLLADGVPVKLVSERLAHARATIMLTVYQHAGMGRPADDRFAGCSRADPRREVSRGPQRHLQRNTPDS